MEPVFHDDSYGYRRAKSAYDAIAVTRKRCWESNWVLEYDIRGLFDSIDHELLLKALRHHCSAGEPHAALDVAGAGDGPVWLRASFRAYLGERGGVIPLRHSSVFWLAALVGNRRFILPILQIWRRNSWKSSPNIMQTPSHLSGLSL